MRASAFVFLAMLLLSSTAHAQTPEIVSHTVISMRSIDFVFSDLMDWHTVENHRNMTIYPTGSPDDSLLTWTIYLDADRVTMQLYLIEPMIDGDSYTLALDGMRNQSGDYVAEGYEYTFTATDLVDPALVAIYFLEPDIIDLRFTEDIVEAEGENTSNFGLFETSAPGNSINTETAKMRGLYDRINLELEQDMILGTEYTITASDLHDLSGNALPAGSELVFTYTGSNSRTMMGLYADFERRNTAVSGTGEYSFDMWVWLRPRETAVEGVLFTMDYPSNVIPQVEELYPALEQSFGSIHSGLVIVFDECHDDWVWVLKQTLTVTDGQPSLVSIYPFSEPDQKNTYFFACDGYRTETPMDVTSNIEINAIDARPTVVAASFSAYTIIDILFSIPLEQSAAEAISNYEIFETAAPGNVKSILSATLQADGRTVRLLSSTDLSAGMGYTARLTGIVSSTGTTIYPGTEITFTATDEDRPNLISAERTGEHTVDIMFDEPVDEITACSVLNYDIIKASDRDFQLDLHSATILEDGITIRLTVSSPMEVGTLYAVLASNVEDLWGNRMLSLRWAEFTADDVYPPEVISTTAISGNIIRVHFSEVVDSSTAVDLNNYSAKYSQTGTYVPFTSAAWEGNDVLLTQSGSYVQGGWYWFWTQNIEDQSGNFFPEWVGTDFHFLIESPQPTIGLYSDPGGISCAVQAHPYEIFDIYVCVNPGPNGIKGIEYGLQNISLQNLEYYVIGVEFDPDHSAYLGDVFTGFSIVTHDCKNDWFWMTKYTCVLIDGRGYIDLIPHPLSGGPQGIICPDPLPLVQLNIVNRLFINEFLVGTLLQSSFAEFKGSGIEVSWKLQEIDGDIDFVVSRRRADEVHFDILDSPSISIDNMSYSFIDSDIENGTSYIYRVEYPENGELHTLFETEEIGTPLLPLTLDQNWPNPFNPSTSIGYYLPESCDVRLEIYDASGRLVNVLQNGTQASGKYNIDWNGTNSIGSQVSSGIYFYRLTAGKATISKKMVLLR